MTLSSTVLIALLYYVNEIRILIRRILRMDGVCVGDAVWGSVWGTVGGTTGVVVVGGGSGGGGGGGGGGAGVCLDERRQRGKFAA